jgi:cellulose synthase/poly-beta-1,6-N-acetylglucosamine synthase-like glycosyltransferase
VRRALIGDSEARLRLVASVSGLADKEPRLSARAILSKGQRNGIIAVLALIVVGLVFEPKDTVIVLLAVITVAYIAISVYRIVLFIRSTRPGVLVQVSDAQARATADDDLPVYTILVPAFRETEVINTLIERLARMEYPTDRLDIKLLVEADDDETIAVITDVDPGDHFELVLIPPADPRTKPKALNYGLTLARGELVAVYDVEDDPDPLQLRRAAYALSQLGPEVGCLQAKLSYNNPNQNIITEWFTIEYAMWFSYLLPGLVSLDAPIPLGGTSNHFRRSVLRSMGAWDPYNVTEDADLGIRMFREGYKVGVLDSVTLEEANSDFVNWIKQRSRWYKGYLQTFFVHLRTPVKVYREIGLRGMVQLVLFVGGTPLLALLNPIFWLMTIVWFVVHPSFIQSVFPAPLYYGSLACWAFGNFLLIYFTVASCRLGRRSELLWAALLVPFYWVMMSMAAAKAFFQLVGAPTFWEKTMHGLHQSSEAGDLSEPLSSSRPGR